MERLRARIYSTKEWKKCRAAYRKSVGNLCERCLARGEIVPGEIVHHKIHLTDQNMNDANIVLSFDNLELLCRQCHADAHPELKRTKRYKVNPDGTIAPY